MKVLGILIHTFKPTQGLIKTTYLVQTPLPNNNQQPVQQIFNCTPTNLGSLYLNSKVALVIAYISFFYYLAYFLYYSWVPLHFLILFMDLTLLFQLTFSFIYNTFSKKFQFQLQLNKLFPNAHLGLV